MMTAVKINITDKTYDRMIEYGLLERGDFDAIVNTWIDNEEKTHETVSEFVESRKGKCINEMRFGTIVSANHKFLHGTCARCGMKQ